MTKQEARAKARKVFGYKGNVRTGKIDTDTYYRVGCDGGASAGTGSFFQYGAGWSWEEAFEQATKNNKPQIS